jgi:hypothetical protein
MSWIDHPIERRSRGRNRSRKGKKQIERRRSLRRRREGLKLVGFSGGGRREEAEGERRRRLAGCRPTPQPGLTRVAVPVRPRRDIASPPSPPCPCSPPQLGFEVRSWMQL